MSVQCTWEITFTHEWDDGDGVDVCMLSRQWNYAFVSVDISLAGSSKEAFLPKTLARHPCALWFVVRKIVYNIPSHCVLLLMEEYYVIAGILCCGWDTKPPLPMRLWLVCYAKFKTDKEFTGLDKLVHFFKLRLGVSVGPLLPRADIILTLVEVDVGLKNLTSPLSRAIRLEDNAGDLVNNVKKNRFRSCESFRKKKEWGLTCWAWLTVEFWHTRTREVSSTASWVVKFYPFITSGIKAQRSRPISNRDVNYHAV